MNKFTSLLEAFLHWESNTPNAIFLKQPINREIVSFTYKEAGEEARKIASALKGYKLEKGDHVALLSKNCAHWILSDLAIMMVGCVSIPIYPSLNANSISLILKHSESKAIIIGKLDNFKSQKEGLPNMPIISIKLYDEYEGDSWEDLIKNNTPLKEFQPQKPDDLHTIIYTSGTTGTPKGVMHSVNNFTVSLSTLIEFIGIPQHINVLSYLPLAHVAERVFCTGVMFVGGQISFSESIETFASDLQEVQPQIFFAVPRIWTKFQEKILESIPQKKLDVFLRIPFLNYLLKKKLKQKLGLSKAFFIVSAAAPIAPSLIIWFQKIGININQGYAMTEDCCVSHFNVSNTNRVGTVGKVLPNVKVKLSPDGEILIKNQCLMLGYYKEPEITASVFDEEGYFKTGDMGEYDHDGFLSITGRIKDQFKTDKGKYISPSYMELVLSKNTNIEQLCVVGSGIPQPIVLITLSELGGSKKRYQLIEELVEMIDNMNPTLEKHERLKKVVVMKEEWSIDNGLLTPTLKVKRNSIEKIHRPFYAEWFKMDDVVIFE